MIGDLHTLKKEVSHDGIKAYVIRDENGTVAATFPMSPVAPDEQQKWLAELFLLILNGH